MSLISEYLASAGAGTKVFVKETGGYTSNPRSGVPSPDRIGRVTSTLVFVGGRKYRRDGTSFQMGQWTNRFALLVPTVALEEGYNDHRRRMILAEIGRRAMIADAKESDYLSLEDVNTLAGALSAAMLLVGVNL